VGVVDRSIGVSLLGFPPASALLILDGEVCVTVWAILPTLPAALSKNAVVELAVED
jgi:hypothetical protein